MCTVNLFSYLFCREPEAKNTNVSILLVTVERQSQFKFDDSDQSVEIQDVVKTENYRNAESQLLNDAPHRPHTFLFPYAGCEDDSNEHIQIGIAYARDKTQRIGKWIATVKNPMIILLSKKTE